LGPVYTNKQITSQKEISEQEIKMGPQILGILFSQLLANPPTSQYANTLLQSSNAITQFVGAFLGGLVQVNSQASGLVQTGAEKLFEEIINKLND
jgi:hypothetical protein